MRLLWLLLASLWSTCRRFVLLKYEDRTPGFIFQILILISEKQLDQALPSETLFSLQFFIERCCMTREELDQRLWLSYELAHLKSCIRSWITRMALAFIDFSIFNQSKYLAHASLSVRHFLEENSLVLWRIQICSNLVALRLFRPPDARHLIHLMQSQKAFGNLLSLQVLLIKRSILAVSLVRH